MKAAQLRAIIALPVMLLVAIPTLLILLLNQFNIGWGMTFPLDLLPTLIGTSFIAVGLALFVATVRLFGTVGDGTLAPWNPPKHLVMRGIYQHVRNPMISGVLFISLGEGLFFGSVAVLECFGIFLVLNLVYIPLIEEKGLKRRFGDEYIEYIHNVPRWIPRVKRWVQPARE
ncbi:MAG TPA: isoprenylcysteine carboxylmethyltransferase family protein [Candidatus Lokiarchaeia archaeon]|nr:isoprenylcysteine carboxylmethyltransferase family protein [Candidatus Lokiarchaeia archaeon]